MKTRVVYLMAFCMVLLSSSAFATNWVEVPGTNGQFYVDADSAVKQGGNLIYWEQQIFHGEGEYLGVHVFKSLVKTE